MFYFTIIFSITNAFPIEKCKDMFNIDSDKNWLLFVRTILGECGFTVYVRTKSTKKDKNYYLISPVKELFKYM